MVGVTKETGLVKYNESFFAKVKRFFMGRFGRKHQEYIEVEDEKMDVAIVEEEPVEKKRSLFNYDAEDNENNNETQTNNNSDSIVFEENNAQDNSSDNNVESNTEDIDLDELTIIGVNANNTQDENDWNPDKGSSAKEEREELERKLMNFYASIKEGI